MSHEFAHHRAKGGRISGNPSKAFILVAFFLCWGASASLLAQAINEPLGTPPANDHFAAREALIGFPVSVEADNTHATREPLEPLHASSFQSHSLWWTWAAPFSGRIGLVVTKAFTPAAVAVYTGTALGSLEEVARQLPAGLLPLEVTAGVTYQIAVDASNQSTEGAFRLELIALPANDQFRDRTVIPAGGAWLNGTTANSTHEEDEPLYSRNGWAGSVWFRWTPEVSGPVWITTLGSSFNADVYVHTGDTLPSLQAVMHVPGPRGTLLHAVAGVTYQMSVTGFHAAGRFTLGLLRAAPNDSFAQRIPVSGTAFVLEGWTMLASAEPGEPGATGPDSLHSVWWTWTAPASGRVIFQSHPNNDAGISVFTGTNVHQLVAVPVSGSAFQATAGQAYQIRGANPQGGGLVEVGWSLFAGPANDHFADRRPLVGSFLTVTSWNFNATREPRERRHADFNLYLHPQERIGSMRTGRSVWWTWTAPSDGWVRINPAGSDFAPLIAVYTGETLPRLKLVTLNRDVLWGHIGGVAEFPAQSGKTYQIVLDGPPTGDRRRPEPAEGRLVFNLDLTTLAVVQPGQGSIFVGPLDLPLRLNDPAPAVDGQISQVRFHTSSHDQAVLPLAESTSGLAATATNLLPGYYLIYATATNHLGVPRLSMPTAIAIRPPNDDFTNSTALEGYAITHQGYIGAASWEKGERRIAGGPPGSGSVWWSWTAPAAGTVSLSIYGGDGIVSAWIGTSPRNLKRIAHSMASEVTFQAKAGTRYHFSTARFNQTFFNSGGAISGLILSLRNVELSAPAPGLVQIEPGTIPLGVRTTEPAQAIARVDYFSGDDWIASASQPPFATVWTNVPAWRHLIHAVAVKTTGEHLPSDSVEVIVRPGNDHLTNAIVLTGTNPVARGVALTATVEPGEPDNPAGNRGTAWWKWTAPAAGRAILRVAGATVKAYAGTRIDDLVPVADAPGTVRFDGDLTFRAHPGQAYLLAAEGPARLEFTIELVSPPANDDFAHRLQVSGSAPQMMVHNFAATAEHDEPRHADLAQGRSVWFVWTAPATASVLLYNSGVGYHMAVGVYTGSTLSNLNRVAGISTRDQGTWFNVVAGQEYAIAAADMQEGVWGVPLGISYQSPPANDDFAQATPLVSLPDLYFNGSILSATRQAGEPAHGSAATGNSVWWTWTAPASGTASVTADTPYFLPRIALYAGSGLLTLTPVAVGTNQLSTTVIGGTEYRLAIDTADGRVGPLSLELHFAPTIGLRAAAAVSTDAGEPVSIRLMILAGAGAGGPPAQRVRIRLQGPPGGRFTLQLSNDLADWSDAIEGTLADGQFEFEDRSAPPSGQRFYRAIIRP